MHRYLSSPLFVSVLTIAGILPLLIGIDRTPIPWVDEVFFASTSISIINGHAAKPSVLDAFPNTGRFDRFYGPVGIYIGAFWMKIFGISARAWRMLSFASGASAIILTALIAWALGAGDVLAAAAAFLLAFTTSLGSSLNSGRLDTLTVAFELTALYLLIQAMRQQLRYRWAYSAVAGLAIAGAALSYPRALTFCLGLAAGAIVLICLAWRKQIYSFAPAALVSTVTVCIWTYSQGLSPVGWLQYLARASRANTGYVSPALGGTWHSRDAIYLPDVAGQVLLALVACCLCWIFLKGRHIIGRRIEHRPELVFLLVVGLTNVLLSFGLLTQEFTHQIFFIAPEIIGLLVLSQLMLEAPQSARASNLLYISWFLFAALGLGIRAAKTVELFQSWSNRDPAPIHIFVSQNIPANSIVLGEEWVYFWAVQDSGSRYLLIEEITNPGLSSGSSLDRTRIVNDTGGQPIYLLWKRGAVMPPEVTALVRQRTASFEVPTATSKLDFFKSMRNRVTSGYPQTDIYALRTY